MTDPVFVHDTATAAARAAGDFIRKVFLDAAAGIALPVEEKHGHADIVTFADRQAEIIIRDILTTRLPQSRILGEEGGWQGQGDLVWYVDPIDGTSNFASGLPWFCVSIAACDADGAPVAAAIFDPIRDEMFSCIGPQLFLNGAPYTTAVQTTDDSGAEVLTNLPREGRQPSAADMAYLGNLFAAFRGVRRLGSAALQLAYVAVGRAAVNYDEGCYPWDIAAGLQLVAASGGQILCWDKASGARMANPLSALEDVSRIVVTTAGYDVARSAVLGSWAEEA